MSRSIFHRWAYRRHTDTGRLDKAIRDHVKQDYAGSGIAPGSRIRLGLDKKHKKTLADLIVESQETEGDAG